MESLKRLREIIQTKSLRVFIKAVKRYFLWHPILDEFKWHIHRLFRSEHHVIKDIFGHKMLLDISKNGIHKHLFLYGCHEPEATRIFSEILPDNARVVDIGTNIGYSAIIETKKAQKVYAIEPEPGNIELLKKNIALNSYDDLIEVHELAVSDTSGTALLSISDVPNQHRLIGPFHKSYGNCIKVETTTLDDFLVDKEINVIRMDVEGAEWLIIKGMGNILQQRSKRLISFIEVHRKLITDYGGNDITLLKIFVNHGFKIHHITFIDYTANFPVLSYFRAKGLPQEQAIEFNPPLESSQSIDSISHILDNLIAYRIFMERV
jgi:FkbM family methyltransferase